MTSNPMIQSRVYENVMLDSKPMTVGGTINKILLLLGIVVLSGAFTWYLSMNGFSDKVSLLSLASLIVGFGLALFTAFNPTQAKITAPVYAVCEGLLLGGISYMFNAYYEGIVINAIAITILAMLSMLLLYRFKLIRATEKFRSVIAISTTAILIFYLAGFIGALFGHPMTIFNGGMLGIGVSLLICIIASLNFIFDFNFIEEGANKCAPETYEWYGAFSLLLTLVWLYLEVLRLLAQLNRRN